MMLQPVQCWRSALFFARIADCGSGSFENKGGFRIADLAYLPDVATIPDDVWPQLQDLDCWVLDALRRTPHPTHAHLDLALEWIARAAPRRAVLTNMHIDLDYAEIESETAQHITPAYDGLVLRYAL